MNKEQDIKRKRLLSAFRKHRNSFAPVMRFDETKDQLTAFCFTRKNKDLTPEIFGSIDQFCVYINRLLKKEKARYGIGGYNELRALYGRSALFNGVAAGEPRRLHLGMDIWGKAGEKVFTPLDAVVHSFAFNNHFGDYGATIILQHELEGVKFHTLYGHCAQADLDKLEPGQPLKKGQRLSQLGKPEENGYWPPHLHFQLIIDMGQYQGDYPGVCAVSKKNEYLYNCPNPDYVLNINRFLPE
ncbi:MAG: peptidoglycan DD-metalloendopeptidase family protein [Dinghuibacter sp.]|nr:peptidoglycan DD-metalloendopeptidase family protein [Dinghuibacter sp.]